MSEMPLYGDGFFKRKVFVCGGGKRQNWGPGGRWMVFRSQGSGVRVQRWGYMTLS